MMKLTRTIDNTNKNYFKDDSMNLHFPSPHTLNRWSLSPFYNMQIDRQVDRE